MEFQHWEPIYEAILADFGYDRAADEAASDWLAERVTPLDPELVDLDGTVAVAGGAPCLSSDLEVVREADAVVAASDAGARLAAVGLRPSLVVTDLDGDPAGTLELAREGVPVAIHAHGDNRTALETWVPEFPPDHVIGTTQAQPRGPLVNVGGFTDGDRAAFLADAFGADELRFPGWDFDVDHPEKRCKLRWAARLLHWLERHRGERFDVLDGRRADLELSGFPEP